MRLCKRAHCAVKSWAIIGDDGSVKSEDLKAAFEAKGASVADAYVPEGKHFGFVSFTTQEDGEKYGTMMNGR